ncbi:MAG: polysaccharide deacetylase family protein [Clostridia bacterium]
MQIIFNRFPFGFNKAISMSYDDGKIYDRKLVEIFDKFNIKATFHLNAGTLDNEDTVKTTEIADLYKNHEISCHTFSHPFLLNSPREQLVYEIYRDRQVLESCSKYPVRGMSYPYGNFNEKIIKEFTSLGIEYSRTVIASNNFNIPSDFMQWNPTCHHRNNISEKLEEFSMIGDDAKKMSLFYVWGHSYEFNDNDNWDLIEEFCEKASNLKNIWFASNIEIYDYIQALSMLKFNVDRTMVYNPSSITCFFDADGELVTAKSGETTYFAK